MQYIGKKVTITFTDGTIYCDILKYTKDKISVSNNWFILGDTAFKVKHVKECCESGEDYSETQTEEYQADEIDDIMYDYNIGEWNP